MDLSEDPIHVLFKLYPWEWLLQEEFATHLLADKTAFLEPPWKMVLSTKAILPILWEMFPDHPNLLPASFRRADFSGPCVEKPFHGREGAGIRLLASGDCGTTGGEPRIWQDFSPLPKFDGRHALIGRLRQARGDRDQGRPVAHYRQHEFVRTALFCVAPGFALEAALLSPNLCDRALSPPP